MSKSKTESKAPLTEVRHFDLVECQFSVVEAAKHLGISRSYVFELLAAKKLRAVKLGKRTLIQGRELKRFMNSLAA